MLNLTKRGLLVFVRVGEFAGFCAGVKAAVSLTEETAKRCECVTLGELIHNPSELQRLKSLGVNVVDSVSDATCGTIIIRSHGVSRDVMRECEKLEIVDATCPYVKRLHDLAHESSKIMPVIIVGEASHPEVQGTAGWCDGDVYIIETIDMARRLRQLQEAAIVAQTTIRREFFESVVDELRLRVARPVIYETICNATATRQNEAERLAAWADVMVVVGGFHSSNTKKLYETCKTLCEKTYLVENALGLNDIIRRGALPHTQNLKVGVTAGASTPDWVLKEVLALMDDINQVTDTEARLADNDDFMKDVEATMVSIRTGQTVSGTVVQVTDDEICVNIGYKSDGIIKVSDIVSKNIAVGDEIEVEVVRVNDGEGNVLLSQRNIVNRKNWAALLAKFEAGEPIEAVGKEIVKGGLICDALGIRAFVPASQLTARFSDKIEQFVGQTLRLKVLEVDKAKKRMVCSRKAVLEEEGAKAKEAAYSKIAEGDVVSGTVRRLTDFGAFVNIGGIDGLIHVTEIAWGHIKHPSDALKVGDEVEVKILTIDRERDRIQLSRKQLLAKPWDYAEEKYPVGSIVEGTVVRNTTFGAFVELEQGLDGLVHISQVSLSRVAKVEDAVQVGQVVRVKILEVNTETKRISLSIRAVLEDEAFMYSDEIPGESRDGTMEFE